MEERMYRKGRTKAKSTTETLRHGEEQNQPQIALMIEENLFAF